MILAEIISIDWNSSHLMDITILASIEIDRSRTYNSFLVQFPLVMFGPVLTIHIRSSILSITIILLISYWLRVFCWVTMSNVWVHCVHTGPHKSGSYTNKAQYLRFMRIRNSWILSELFPHWILFWLFVLYPNPVLGL